ncbi:MAG: hypothetical protein HY690_06925 [Chloroflexi bacterium]|nr:hypothetical protein [Chloroflexota bacterium]
MRQLSLSAGLSALVLALLVLAACAPAAPPSPTAPPPKPAATTAPAPQPTQPPAAKPTEKPAPTAAAVQPTARPTEPPAAKPAFDEKAVADFYKGKTLRLIVGAGVGGGYDTYSRLIARHIIKYIPSNPTVVVENMGGGGSLLATNYLYNVAPKDGTVLASMQGTVIGQQLFGSPGVQFDVANLHFLGAPTSDNYLLMVAKKSGITKLDDVLGPNGKRIVLGGDAPGNALEDSAVVLRDVVGANVKLVSGYDGTAKIRLAMDNGEVDGMSGMSWESARISSRDQLESGEWLILVQFREQPHKDLPKVPLITTYTRTDEQRQLLRFSLIAPGQFARPYIVHASVPPDRVAALEAAFARTMADKEFLAEAEKTKLDITPLAGSEVRKLVAEYTGMSADLKAKLQKVLRPSGR